ncbi:MAG: hypothetical protein AAF570_05070, partial [Bacteroidota bacterium]
MHFVLDFFQKIETFFEKDRSWHGFGLGLTNQNQFFKQIIMILYLRASLLATALFLCTSSLFAQTNDASTGTDSYRHEFGVGGLTNLRLNSYSPLMSMKWLKEKGAFRVMLNANVNLNDLSRDVQQGSTDETVNTRNHITLRSGIEKWLGNDKFTPYFGVDGMLGFANNRSRRDQFLTDQNQETNYREDRSTISVYSVGAIGFAGVR